MFFTGRRGVCSSVPPKEPVLINTNPFSVGARAAPPCRLALPGLARGVGMAPHSADMPEDLRAGVPASLPVWLTSGRPCEVSALLSWLFSVL